MIRSRRFALIAAVPALAVMALSACGDDARDGALGQSAPAIIHIGSGSGTGGSKLAGVPGAESGVAGDAAMWAPWIQYTYSFAGDASGLPASGAAWSFATGGSPDAARVAAIAASFGLSGELQPLPAEYGGGWVVGSTDYTGPSLMVGTDGLLSWWYNVGPTEGDRAVSGCAEGVAGATVPGSDSAGGTSAGAPDEATTDTMVVDSPPCVIAEPTPPANVPNSTEAEDLFRGLLAEWGYDAGSVTLETYADEWGAYVTGYLSLGGFRSPATVSAGFGAEGAVTWASGTLAEAVPAGEYPLVSVDEAISRLNDRTGKWGWFGGWSAYAKGGIAVDAATSSVGVVGEASAVAETVAVDPAVACDPAADCVPEPITLDTFPTEPEEVAVEFTGVILETTTVWGEDGTVYVLPAYTFTAADGMTATMVAVGEEYLDLPEPAVAETVPGDTPTVDTAVSVTTWPATEGTDLVHPTPETLPAEVDVVAAEASLVGLSLEEATKVAEQAGWTLRESTIDGEGQSLTEDYSPTRVNVAVEAGVVVGIDFIG